MRQENKILKRAKPGASPSTAGPEVSTAGASSTQDREKRGKRGRIIRKAREKGKMQREGKGKRAQW